MEKESFARRFQKGLQFFARYWVGTIFLVYAAPKIMGTQFRVLESVYDTPLGHVSDFWLAWSFFARSYYYQMMLGCAEITIGFMLIFRRTKTLGALCSLPITINIIMVDCFFGVATGALVVATTLLIGALYVLFPDIPRLKAFFLSEQEGSSTGRRVAVSLIYGVVVFSIMIGVIAYVARIVPRAFDGAYKIERYAINGTPQPLGPGQYGRDPMLYIEVRNSIVLSLNGKNTVGTYAIDQATQEITWTEDITQPDEVSKGKCQTNGDEMTLRVERGTDDVELLLKRIAKHTG